MLTPAGVPPIRLTTTKTSRSSDREIAEVRSLLGVELPQYEWFVVTLGEGCLSGTVRVYSPERVLAVIDDFRARWAAYFFWDGGGSEVTLDDLARAVPLADSVDGDEVVYVPGRGLLFLPRHDDVAVAVGPDLFSAVDYICFSGQVFESNGDTELWFESYVDRTRQFFHGVERPTHDTLKALAAALTPLASTPVKVEGDGYMHVELPLMDGVLSVWGSSATLSIDVEVDANSVVAILTRHGFRRVG